jgi:hypothetical protein
MAQFDKGWKGYIMSLILRMGHPSRGEKIVPDLPDTETEQGMARDG